MDKLTPAKIAELRALLAKATPGEWRLYTNKLRPQFDLRIIEIQGPRDPAVVKWGGFDESARSYAGHKANAALIVAMKNALPALLDAAERASRAREDALREAARVAESMETLEAWLPTGPNGEGKDRHATIHGAKIAAAILALIDKPKGGDANEGRSGTTRETRHPATSPGVTAGGSHVATAARRGQ